MLRTLLLFSLTAVSLPAADWIDLMPYPSGGVAFDPDGKHLLATVAVPPAAYSYAPRPRSRLDRWTATMNLGQARRYEAVLIDATTAATLAPPFLSRQPCVVMLALLPLAAGITGWRIRRRRGAPAAPAGRAAASAAEPS